MTAVSSLVCTPADQVGLVLYIEEAITLVEKQKLRVNSDALLAAANGTTTAASNTTLASTFQPNPYTTTGSGGIP
jgi:hypothetical protein